MFKPSLGTALIASVLAFANARAAEFEPFSEARLAALQKEGKTVLVDVHADWCPTCKRQSPILSRLLDEVEFAEYGALLLDWDVQRAQARSLGAPRQSTLLVYRGGQRLGMSVAETNEDRLRQFLATGSGN
jgi:thioredoxin 1